jgi:MFS family permease
MTVNMKIDLAGSHERGLAMGLNEFAGYSGLALVASLTGFIAEQYGLRPMPFYLGVGLAVAGFALSLLIRDTRAVRDAQAEVEVAPSQPTGRHPANPSYPSFKQVFRRASWTDHRLSSASLAGLMTNLKDGMLWGLLPILLASRGLRIAEIGLVVAVYPAVWGLAQLIAGPLSDRVSRRALIAWGLVVQGGAVAAFVIMDSYAGSLVAATLAGVGTALVYPTLQAFVSDVAARSWRAAALGVYRFWRDFGYALGALSAGVLADALGIGFTFASVAVLLGLAALAFAWRANAVQWARNEQPG